MKTVTERLTRSAVQTSASVTTAVCGDCDPPCALHRVADLPVEEGLLRIEADTCGDHVLGESSSLAAIRTTAPRKRNSSGQLVQVDWDTALRELVGRIKELQWRLGRQSVAVLAPAQLSLEESGLLQMLSHQVLGAVYGGADIRSEVSACSHVYQQAFGSRFPPYTLKDLEESDALVLLGTDFSQLHPELWQRILCSGELPELVAVDSRITQTAARASQHLHVRPGTETTLLTGVARYLISEQLIDRQFIEHSTRGFEALQAQLEPFHLQRVAAETGLSSEQIIAFARLLSERSRVSLWWSTADAGPETARLAAAAINLSLLTGNIGRTGTGPNALLVPCGALGGMLPLAAAPGTRWSDICDLIENEKIKGLWIIATDAAPLWLEELLTRDVLHRLEFLVVQDLTVESVIGATADVFLPSAGWGEKTGTFATTERRIKIARPVRERPGEAQSDFEIFQQVARYWGCGHRIDAWKSPEAAFEVLKELSSGTDWDLTGIEGFESLTAADGIQFPHEQGSSNGAAHRRLYESGKFATPDGRARFLPVSDQLPASAESDRL